MISAAPSLIEAASESMAAVAHLGLEVCPELEQALARLGRPEVALVLVHLNAASDHAAVTRLIAAAVARTPPCAAAVLADTYRDHEAAAFRRAGAADYLGPHQVSARLTYLLDTLTLPARLGLRPSAAGTLSVGEGPPLAFAPEMAELLGQLRRVAPQDATLLFTGETGTGKTRLARLVHALSPRRAEPFLVVDCGALSPALVESELFGHVKGAFTGAERDRPGKLAAAGGGTLLLDEVNSLPGPLQAKLLRAVDERVFEPVGSDRPQPLRARLVAASNRPLEAEVAQGRFRPDLYHRLNVVGFHLPPLRERRTAVPPLAETFLAEFAARAGRAFYGIAPEAVRALQGYDWPGNIRELRNVVERAVALCPNGTIGLADLPECIRSPAACAAGPHPAASPTDPTPRRRAALR
jgi:two-component system response regulator HydG